MPAWSCFSLATTSLSFVSHDLVRPSSAPIRSRLKDRGPVEDSREPLHHEAQRPQPRVADWRLVVILLLVFRLMIHSERNDYGVERCRDVEAGGSPTRFWRATRKRCLSGRPGGGARGARAVARARAREVVRSASLIRRISPSGMSCFNLCSSGSSPPLLRDPKPKHGAAPESRRVQRRRTPRPEWPDRPQDQKRPAAAVPQHHPQVNAPQAGVDDGVDKQVPDKTRPGDAPRRRMRRLPATPPG